MSVPSLRRTLAPVALALVAGCSVPAEPSPTDHSSMTTPPSTKAESAAERPPLDLRAPAHLETATFALG